jgi:molecular chaperone DnaK
MLKITLKKTSRMKEVADVKNTAEMLIFSAEKETKEYEAKISKEIADGINEKVTALKTVKDGSDIEAIKKATQDLSSEISKIGEALQKAGADAQPTTPEQQNPEVDTTRCKGC